MFLFLNQGHFCWLYRGVHEDPYARTLSKIIRENNCYENLMLHHGEILDRFNPRNNFSKIDLHPK